MSHDDGACFEMRFDIVQCVSTSRNHIVWFVGHLTVRDIFAQEAQLMDMQHRQRVLYELLKKEGKVSQAVSILLKRVPSVSIDLEPPPPPRRQSIDNAIHHVTDDDSDSLEGHHPNVDV